MEKKEPTLRVLLRGKDSLALWGKDWKARAEGTKSPQLKKLCLKLSKAYEDLSDYLEKEHPVRWGVWLRTKPRIPGFHWSGAGHNKGKIPTWPTKEEAQEQADRWNAIHGHIKGETDWFEARLYLDKKDK